jgi:hypothetical protein
MTLQDTLQALQDQMPQLDAEAKRRSDTARQIMLQNQLGATQLQPGQPIQTAAQMAQTIAPQVAEVAGQQAAQQTASSQAQVTQLEQQYQSKLEMDRRHQIELASVRAQKTVDDRKNQLASMGSDLKQKLFDDTMQFENSELGRKMTNDRQLQDWAILSAQNEQEARDKLQIMQLVAERKIKLLATAEQRLLDAAKRGWLSKEQVLDQAAKEELVRKAQDLRNKIMKEQAKAKNRAMMFQGAGMIIGGIAGIPLGNPVLGAAIGGAAATGVAGATG